MKAVVLFVLVLGVGTESLAQTNVGLTGSPDTISFTGTGGADDVTMPGEMLCDDAHCIGVGSGLAFADSGSSLGGGGTITLTNLGGEAWSVTNTSAPLSCSSSLWDCGGAVFVEGNQLDNFARYGVLGVLSNAEVPNPVVTKGTLESVSGPQASMNFLLADVDPDLGGLLNFDNTMAGGYVSSASLTPADLPSMPEPMPLVLLGTALILAALLLRRLLPSGDR